MVHLFKILFGCDWEVWTPVVRVVGVSSKQEVFPCTVDRMHLVGPLQGGVGGCKSCFHQHGCYLEISSQVNLNSIVGKDQGLKPESTIFEELLYLSWCRRVVSVLPDRRLSWSVSCVAVVDGAGYGHSKWREFLCEHSSNWWQRFPAGRARGHGESRMED